MFLTDFFADAFSFFSCVTGGFTVLGGIGLLLTFKSKNL